MPHYLDTTVKIKTLEKAVTTAFFAAGITQANMYSGAIQFTDLPWQNPPLTAQQKLLGIPLKEYLKTNIDTDLNNLYKFWQEKLGVMYHNPSTLLLKDDSFDGLDQVFRRTQLGQKRLCFSLPAGYPNHVDEYAGIVFSLEVADVAMNCTNFERTTTENDYYVTFPDGRILGVKHGLPAVASPWEAAARGIVWDLLDMPRGYTEYNCLHDPLAKLRSLLHENRDKFPEFVAVDYAMQALRRLYRHNGMCSILLKAAKITNNLQDYKAQIKAVKTAIATMERNDISDRSKAQILYSTLVPMVWVETKFNSKVVNINGKLPFTFANSVLDRINNNLAVALKDLPCSPND
jgi:hypothetical protein